MKTQVGKNEQGSAELILVIVIIVAIIGAVGYVAYLRLQSQPSTTTSSITPTKQLTHPGTVNSVVFAASIDNMDAPISPTASFTTSIPKIYVVLGMVNAKASQRVEYTRYLNGKFVDNGSIPVKDGAKYASFAYSIQPGKMHLIGTYTVKLYTDGVYERSAIYSVQ